MEKEKLYRQLMWDYNISVNDIDKLLSGEVSHIGHYTRTELFRKMLETFPWFTILEILNPKQISELLDKNVIEKLRTPSQREKYRYVRKRLQEVVRHSR